MATVFCDTELTTGDNDGSSWEDAYQSIGTALTNATSSDQIWWKATTYTLTGSISVGHDHIYGGFARDLTGTSGSVAGRDLDTDKTILTGSYRAFSCGTDGFIIDGITFNATGAIAGHGGAISASATGTVSNCTFNDCEVTGTYDGGAIYVNSSAATFTIEDSVFNNCVSADEGGAISCNGVGNNLQIDTCEFNNCEADDGGAVYIGSSDFFDIIDCTFNSNSATNDGGAVYLYECGLSNVINRSIFDGNSATGDGGALFFNCGAGSDYHVQKNCLFTNNSATNGGAILSNGSGANVTNTNCTFADNSATTNGGAIYQSGGTVEVYNSIVWDCGTTPITRSSGSIDVQNSDVEGGHSGTGNVNVDPQFCGTGYPYPYYPNQLTTIVDGGSSSLSGYSSLDILGVARYDDPNATNFDSSASDMGCYEWTGAVIADTMDYSHYFVTANVGDEAFRFHIPLMVPRGPRDWVYKDFDDCNLSQKFRYGAEIISPGSGTMYEKWTVRSRPFNKSLYRETDSIGPAPSWTSGTFPEQYQSNNTYHGTHGGIIQGWNFGNRTDDYPPQALEVTYAISLSELAYNDGEVYNVYVESFLIGDFNDGDIDTTLHSSATNIYDPDMPLSAYHVRETERQLNKITFELRSIFSVPVYGKTDGTI